MAKSKLNLTVSMCSVVLSCMSSIVLARALGVSSYGLYVSIAALSSIAIKFVGFGANTFLSIKISRKSVGISSFIAGLIMNIIGGFIAFLISVATLAAFDDLQFLGHNRMIVIMMLSLVNLLAISDYFLALLSGAGQHYKTTIVGCLEAVARAVIACFILIQRITVINAVILLVIPTALRFILSVIMATRNLDDIWVGSGAVKMSNVKRVLFPVIYYSLPLSVGVGFLGLYMRSPMVVAAGRILPGEVALLSAVLASAGIFSGLGDSYLANLQKFSFSLNPVDFRRLQFRQLIYLITGACLSSVCAPALISLMFADLSLLDLTNSCLASLGICISQVISLLHGQSLRKNGMEVLAPIRFVSATVISVPIMSLCIEHLDKSQYFVVSFLAFYAFSLGLSTIVSAALEGFLVSQRNSRSFLA